MRHSEIMSAVHERIAVAKRQVQVQKPLAITVSSYRILYYYCTTLWLRTAYSFPAYTENRK